MGVIVAGRKVSLSEPGIVRIGDIYVFEYRAEGGIRGYCIDNLSSATILVRFSGGQPSSSAQYNGRVQAYETQAFPVSDDKSVGVNALYVYSTNPAAEFLFSAFDHAVNPAFKGNPATVPTAAAVKLEDRTTGGQWAVVSAAGEVLVSGSLSIAGTPNVDVTDEVGRLLGIVSSITNALPAGNNNIGDVDVLSLPAATVAGSATLPAGANNIGDVDVATLPTGAAVDRAAVLGAAAAANFWPVNQKGGLLFNDTGAVLYCRYSGAAAAANHDFELADQGIYEAPPAMPSSALSVLSVAGGQVRGFSF